MCRVVLLGLVVAFLLGTGSGCGEREPNIIMPTVPRGDPGPVGMSGGAAPSSQKESLKKQAVPSDPPPSESSLPKQQNEGSEPKAKTPKS